MNTTAAVSRGHEEIANGEPEHFSFAAPQKAAVLLHRSERQLRAIRGAGATQTYPLFPGFGHSGQ
jgi:hypothetical protein